MSLFTVNISNLSIISGDHGARIGSLRNSMQGSLEERLPWLSIVLPKWFNKKYPDMTKNLKHNQDVVTTAFDVHATLRHLMTFPKIAPGQKTQSLFSKIVPHRSCADAGKFFVNFLSVFLVNVL